MQKEASYDGATGPRPREEGGKRVRSAATRASDSAVGLRVRIERFHDGGAAHMRLS